MPSEVLVLPPVLSYEELRDETEPSVFLDLPATDVILPLESRATPVRSYPPEFRATPLWSYPPEVRVLDDELRVL